MKKEIFLSDASNISMNMPQNVNEKCAMHKMSMIRPQNVEEMCAENKTSMNRRQNVEEMCAKNKTSMNRRQNVEEMSARDKTSMNMPQNMEEICGMNKTSMNMPQNVDEMCAMDKMPRETPQNREKLQPPRENVLGIATKPGETAAKEQKSPRSNTGGLISECYDVFYEYLHANDNQNHTAPDFGFFAGLVAELAAALQTNIGCNCCGNKCVECGETNILQIYI